MKLYRLVHETNDPVTPDKILTRSSDHSNQKFGPGMYFAISRESAMQFAQTRKYKYTHLLECKVSNVKDCDIVDLVNNPLLITKWKQTGKPIPEEYLRYCTKHELKGIKWEARAGWIEVVIHHPHYLNNVKIVKSERLLQEDG